MYKRIIAIVITAIALASCDKIDELTKFDVDYNTEFTVQATTLIDSPLEIVTPETTTNSDQEFENNNTNTDLVESAKLTELRLDLLAPDSGNFDFLNEIRIYIRAEGLEERLIASRIAIPESGLRTLQLDVEDEELKEFIKKESYQLRTETITDQTIESNHTINVYTKFRIDAEILGV